MNDLSNKNVKKNMVTIRGGSRHYHKEEGSRFLFFLRKKLYFKTFCFKKNQPDIKIYWCIDYLIPSLKL